MSSCWRSGTALITSPRYASRRKWSASICSTHSRSCRTFRTEVWPTSGGGLPGVPIAIVQPERSVTLNDSNQKKTAFLRQASIELELSNASVHAGRVEDWHPLERFAVVITRGFAELAEFVALCRHLVAPRGVLAAMKGVYPSEELARVQAAQRCDKVVRLRVPLLDAERHLVLCRAGA